jgi:hypothetical protein
MATEAHALPAGSVLVHIGPYKTGSTAIQHSLAAHRADLEHHGVWYPGPHYRHLRPSWAVVERPMRGVAPVPMSEWDDFAAAVRARSADRVCVSSEDLVMATERQAARVVGDLGGDRVHVLLVARRLDRLLPSAWQERVKSSNETLGYDDFLAAATDPARTHPSSQEFWFNHELTAIVDRWTASLPTERVHVLVADEESRDRTARIFEQLLGLPAGLLTPAGRDNESLSFERVDLVRRLNEVFDEHGWPDRARLRLIHRGLLGGLEDVPVGAHETRIPPVPDWAHARLAELDEERIAALRRPGLDVLGDPELLRSRPEPGARTPDPARLDVEVVARAVEGLVAARLKQPAPPPRAAGADASSGLVTRSAVPASTQADDEAGDGAGAGEPATLLPEGAVLVHIGPYKTGTTAIQSSLHEHRAELAAAGVTYPGTRQRQMRPSWALLGRSRLGEATVPAAEWDELVDEVRAATGRVVISSEDFSSAGPQQVQRLVDDLGPDRVHVLVTARRLDTLLPSAWQERVKSVNETRTYDAWLREVLAPDRESQPARAFWHNHGLQSLIERWRAALPADRVIVMVSDETDRRLQARTFEQLLGLPAGLLTPGTHSNTSLSMERIEFCRQVNLAVEQRGWVGSRTLNAPRRGLLAGLRAAPLADDESAIPPLPEWTAARLAELSAQRADVVATSGVRVLGDPALLRHQAGVADPGSYQLPTSLPVAAAASAVEHAFARLLERARPPGPTKKRKAPALEPRPPADPLAGLSSRRLLREVGRRQAARLRGRPRA